jgi:diguanylate cyclase (GGDEF)-like protein
VSQARILAVDDQLYFRVYLEDLLRELGYAVTTAATGAEALAQLEAARFDLVLTDLVMPGMDGSELVQRVKERFPSQEIVVITSVGDVKTAVDAMKLGATDYLLKPLDRAALTRALDAIFERRRLRAEHGQLVAENIEFMGVFTQYERLLGLFATLEVEPLVDRIVDLLCLETHAHGGVAWIARADAPERLRLSGVSGLVRVQGERSELALADLPRELAPLAQPGAGPLLTALEAGQRACLVVPLASGGRLLGIVRLSDKLDGNEFGSADIAAAERLGSCAAQALANAMAFRSLERRSLRDPTTQTYTRAYLDDVVLNEIQKARRFSRSFSLVRIEIDGLEAMRESFPPAEVARFLQGAAGTLVRALRSSDLLAAEGEGVYFALLPETDGLGATVSKRRLRAALDHSALLRELPEPPTVLAATATFPTDGATADSLWETLAQRSGEDRGSFVRARSLEQAPFRGLVDALLAEAPLAPSHTAEQAMDLLLSEVERRPHERGLLFLGTGGELSDPLRKGLERLRSLPLQTDVVVVAEQAPEASAGLAVTWVSPQRAGTDAPFVVYFGDGPPYALVREPGDESGDVALYHTADPVLVEHLAFQLGRDLGIPIGG